MGKTSSCNTPSSHFLSRTGGNQPHDKIGLVTSAISGVRNTSPDESRSPVSSRQSRCRLGVYKASQILGRIHLMRLLILSVAVACQLLPLASRAPGEESASKTERLHFEFSFPQGHKVLFELTSASAQHVLSTSILQLTGNVEVRMTTCPPQGHTCVKSPMILHADTVDYNEATGQIDAHGNVHTTFRDHSPGQQRSQGHEPEPLQRPVIARAASGISQ